jgi:hypothetical protein
MRRIVHQPFNPAQTSNYNGFSGLNGYVYYKCIDCSEPHGPSPDEGKSGSERGHSRGFRVAGFPWRKSDR